MYRKWISKEEAMQMFPDVNEEMKKFEQGFSYKPAHKKKGSNMLQAYKNNVIALPVEVKEKESKLILMPEKKVKDYLLARIVSVGSDIPDLNEGDIILYRNYSAVKIEFADEEYLMMDASGIMAIVRDI